MTIAIEGDAGAMITATSTVEKNTGSVYWAASKRSVVATFRLVFATLEQRVVFGLGIELLPETVPCTIERCVMRAMFRMSATSQAAGIGLTTP
jgi:hypothetical protein